MLFNIFVINGLIGCLQICQGLYIKPTVKIGNSGLRETHNNHDDEWAMFKHNLALTNEKVALLKSQNDQARVKELLYDYMKRNTKNLPSLSFINDFQIIDKHLLNTMKSSRQVVRTSFKLELGDTAFTKTRNGQSKIAIKLTAAMPINEIINIINIYNRKSFNTTTITMTTTKTTKSNKSH